MPNQFQKQRAPEEAPRPQADPTYTEIPVDPVDDLLAELEELRNQPTQETAAVKSTSGCGCGGAFVVEYSAPKSTPWDKGGGF